MGLTGAECFVNDERTRTFVAVPMRREGREGQQAFKQVRVCTWDLGDA